MQLSMKVAPGPLTRASGLRQRSLEKQHERNIKKAKKGFGPYASGRPSGSEQSAPSDPSGGGSEQSAPEDPSGGGSWPQWHWHGWQDRTQWDWK